MAAINWHLAFIVYMIPIIPLVLIPFMTDSYIDSHKQLRPAPPFEPKSEPVCPSDDDINKAKVTKKPASVNFHFQGSLSLILLFGVMACISS